MHQLIRHRVVGPSFVVSSAASEADVERTAGAVAAALETYSAALATVDPTPNLGAGASRSCSAPGRQLPCSTHLTKRGHRDNIASVQACGPQLFNHLVGDVPGQDDDLIGSSGDEVGGGDDPDTRAGHSAALLAW